MGNYNSGLRTSRWTTADMRRLDIRELIRAGELVEGKTFGWRWWRESGEQLHQASITVRRDCVNIAHNCLRDASGVAHGSYAINITRTPCALGGHQAWWQCPVMGCGRRVAILYGCNGAVFACRHCYRLNYRSQRETDSDRLVRRLDKLRARLGWVPGCLNGHGDKPHRMRWRTFWLLQRQHDELMMAVLGGISQRFGNFLQRG